MLQNIRTQTHESPLIQQNQPKSSTNSIQGKQYTSSETQTCEEGRKKKEKKKEKEKESYPDVKKEERKKGKRKREKSYLDVNKEERKRKKSYPDEEGRKKKERKKEELEE